MTRYTTTSSRPHESVLPRARSGFTREHTHGSLQPLTLEARDTRSIVRPHYDRLRPLLWLSVIGIGGAVLLFGLPLVRFGFERINLW